MLTLAYIDIVDDMKVVELISDDDYRNEGYRFKVEYLTQ